MWLLLVVICTLVFSVADFYLFNKDYFHPAFIFSIMFFLSSAFCFVCAKTYQIHFHAGTFWTLFFTLFAFTVFSIFTEKISFYPKSAQVNIPKLKKIEVSRITLLLLIIIQLVTIYYFIKHLHAFSYSYDGKGRSLPDAIDLYDKISKFHPRVFARKEPPAPILYRIGDPISRAGGFVCLYILINNFLISKKVDILCGVPVIGLSVIIFLRGSRSPLLRILTMVVFLYYILSYRFRIIRKGDVKIAVRILNVLLFASLGFVLMLPLMGRRGAENSGGLLNYFFIYIGAPLLNLDTFIASGEAHLFTSVNPSLVWGNYTLTGFFSLLSTVFPLNNYDPMFSIGGWAISENGLNTGNVYTHFYSMLYDFGYFGTFLVNLVFIGYYAISYSKLIRSCPNSLFDFRLFLYSYLFNDLIMSIFSPRFFETLSSKSFLKVMVVSYLISLLLNKQVEISSGRVVLRLNPKISLTGNIKRLLSTK